jgi:VIT1/CCC1 family predicted Fe2+/Mn2+ transporter
MQASVASAISFSIGAAIPLLSAAFIKDPMIRWPACQLLMPLAP